MIGLLLATIYVMVSSLFYQMEIIAALEASLSFLWVWHLIFGGIVGSLGIFLILVGSFLLIFGKGGKEKWGGVASLCISPFLFLSPVGYLLAVYSMGQGVEGGEIVNQEYLVGGALLYGMMILSSLYFRSSSSS